MLQKRSVHPYRGKLNVPDGRGPLETAAPLPAFQYVATDFPLVSDIQAAPCSRSEALRVSLDGKKGSPSEVLIDFDGFHLVPFKKCISKSSDHEQPLSDNIETPPSSCKQGMEASCKEQVSTSSHFRVLDTLNEGNNESQAEAVPGDIPVLRNLERMNEYGLQVDVARTDTKTGPEENLTNDPSKMVDEHSEAENAHSKSTDIEGLLQQAKTWRRGHHPRGRGCGCRHGRVDWYAMREEERKIGIRIREKLGL